MSEIQFDDGLVRISPAALLKALRYVAESEECDCDEEDAINGDCCYTCDRRAQLVFLKDAGTDVGLHGYLAREFEHVFLGE